MSTSTIVSPQKSSKVRYKSNIRDQKNPMVRTTTGIVGVRIQKSQDGIPESQGDSQIKISNPSPTRSKRNRLRSGMEK